MTTHRFAPMLLALTALATGLVGCHRPHGAMLPYTGGSQTYPSSEMVPQSLELRDLRSNEVVFQMDIPAGKQLTLQFLLNEGDDPVYTPDLMIYEVMDLGTTTGKLNNAMSVPPAVARRVDVMVRPGPEYITAAPGRELRTDELIDRPDWWTPDGGELNEHSAIENYHD